MEKKKVRELKVVEQAGYQYKPTPTITLKGQWLKDWGFEIGDKIQVNCKSGELIISRCEE